ncbi:helix-turn-helix domain-containing protein [Actinoplanes sp. NPDC051859]|uniref:helix-turn-helix domain-containing protein n=1 Tax=Actinoplanes sp. NPDC051859 TaxID=3363909 RepID=UPI0037AF2E53
MHPPGEMAGRPDSTQALAAVLRDLKNRQGRSFEALAKRLAVSKSALHRYTSGEVVPAKFSIVELWARECGATAAEIAELHRLWSTAVADPPSAAPTTEAAPEEPATRRHRHWIAAAALTSVIGVGTTMIVLARSEHAAPAHEQAAEDGAPGQCEARAGVRHVDARRYGHVWRADYVCPNTVGTALYDEPGGARKIAVMETGKSWFTCWTRMDSQIWYYTRGDRSEPGTEAWDGWGFIPAEHVPLAAHPAPAMPDCWFALADSPGPPPAAGYPTPSRAPAVKPG